MIGGFVCIEQIIIVYALARLNWKKPRIQKGKKMSECNHDYENALRKGRAWYVCPNCGNDITLELVLIRMAESESEGENE